jgi:hypothetical protein
MTRAEAREITKSKAPNQYHGTALGLLSNLVDASFGPDGVRTVTFKDTTLMRRVGIRERQLSRILDRFAADKLGEFTRKADKITVRLDLSPLSQLPVKITEKAVKVDRARKAREAYAQEKEARACAQFVRNYFETVAAENANRVEMHTVHP